MFVGRWAIEVADDYPNAQVIGMDLSPMQPTYVPQNCEFIVGDLTESLADFDDGSFDLVHSRYLNPLTPLSSLPFLSTIPYTFCNPRVRLHSEPTFAIRLWGDVPGLIQGISTRA